MPTKINTYELSRRTAHALDCMRTAQDRLKAIKKDGLDSRPNRSHAAQRLRDAEQAIRDAKYELREIERAEAQS